ncbi:ribosomal protein [Dermatophagoides farinae]|uniref:Ribosomal protein n=1 Tax=Dermatophagoides farinae TaxID=6954 RepID=A0A922HTI2_DERFA|nr:ribosomal protein [Dermatophagoides farinae]
MGRVRNKTIKEASRLIIEQYYLHLTLDFHIQIEKKYAMKLYSSIYNCLHDPAFEWRSVVSLKPLNSASEFSKVAGISALAVLEGVAGAKVKPMDVGKSGISFVDSPYSIGERIFLLD